jgi:MFS family permease
MICPFYLGYDQSLLTGLQAIPQWNTYFHSPSGNWLGLIAATIFIPGIIFGFPADWICDRWGRRWAIYLGSVLIIIGGIFNGLSQNAGQFMGARAIIGAGGSITKVAAPALLQEAAHPRLRSPMGTMYYGFYYTGSLTSAIMCIIGLYIKGDWGWRLPCIFQIVGPIAVLSILVTAPESPRYLVKKGRHEEALAMLAKFHANGDTDDQLVAWELKEITVALEQEMIANKSSYVSMTTKEIKSWQRERERSVALLTLAQVDFFKTRGNRKRFYVAMAITVGVNWVGNGIVSYYLSPVLKSVGVTKAVEITGINAGLAFWNLVIAMFAGLNVERFGRRPLFLISTAGMIISYAFVMGFSAGFATTGKAALGVAAIPFLFLFYGSYDIAWTPVRATSQIFFETPADIF